MCKPQVYPLNLHVNISKFNLIFPLTSRLCLQAQVIYDPCHFSLHLFLSRDPRLTVLIRGHGVWGESPVMEGNHSRNWNGNFLIQEDDLCWHRNPQPHCIINTWGKKTFHRIHCSVVSLMCPLSPLPPLPSLPPLLCYFYSTSLRLDCDMLIGKIIFLHPECAGLDKDGRVERHGNLRYVW